MYRQVASSAKKIKMKILLLGSGEWEKNLQLPQRIGQTIIAVDSYENAPAMQVAHGLKSSTCLTEKL
jgi:formate-dependent phosphoribosylglycinamide formyltransferase (GAR transformylase)